MIPQATEEDVHGRGQPDTISRLTQVQKESVLDWIKQATKTHTRAVKRIPQNTIPMTQREKNHAFQNVLIVTRKERKPRKLFGDFSKKRPP